jgi:hypothetical protein
MLLPVGLEDDVDASLELAAAVLLAVDGAEGRRGWAEVRGGELDAVECVEGVDARLYHDSVVDVEVLQNREVPVVGDVGAKRHQGEGAVVVGGWLDRGRVGRRDLDAGVEDGGVEDSCGLVGMVIEVFEVGSGVDHISPAVRSSGEEAID